tara:strand:+ start:340 stop:1191 length:852 start_codon:yes stop_codon:yes gene_type:complete
VNNYQLPDGNVQIAFSGGRTSGFMLHEILKANNGLPDRAKVIFTNTGREMNETYDFIQECSDRWNVHITWLEYEKKPNERVNYNIVNHNSASRKGEPFSNLIDYSKRLPNVYQRFCTQELKVKTVRRYLVRELKWKKWSTAIGIRSDETHRAKYKGDSKETEWYPIIPNSISQRDIISFWKRQSFDLKVTKGFGNCDGCFLKSEKTLAVLWRLYPQRATWWSEQEHKVFPGKDPKKHIMQTFKKQLNNGNSYSELGDLVSRQSDWIFDQEDYFCQTDDGECTG